jgi:hypothetical protein
MYNSTPNIIQIDVNTSGGISANSSFTITIYDIINPSTPDQSYPFALETYYTYGDYTSKVEVGKSIPSQSCIPRAINLIRRDPNQTYEVIQSPASLALFYYPGVDLPSPSILSLNFMSNVTDILFISASKDNTSYNLSTSQSGGNVTLTIMSPPGTKIKTNT